MREIVEATLTQGPRRGLRRSEAGAPNGTINHSAPHKKRLVSTQKLALQNHFFRSLDGFE
jgi:hypothetical protein